MSSEGGRSGGTSRGDVGRELGTALVLVPGVRRLEPSLRSTLRMLGRTAGDSVPVTLKGGTADVRIDIATDTTRPAVTVAAEVQRRTEEILVAHGLVPGTIEVSVLSVEA